MSSRSRTRQARSTQRPLGGHLHEMATTRPVPAPPQQWWHNPHLAGQALIHNPQVFVLGHPGSGKGRRQPRLGKTALARTLHLEAWRRSQRAWRPLVVLDEVAACEPVDPSTLARGVLDPFALAPRPSTPSVRTAGEW